MYCMSAGFYFLTIFVPLVTFEALFEALSEMMFCAYFQTPPPFVMQMFATLPIQKKDSRMQNGSSDCLIVTTLTADDR